jgi:hypothetical protein
MRKYLAITFLALYVFTSTEFHEIMKLPNLVSHYNEHKEENKNLTLWKFLCIHYAHGDVFDDDRDKDMKLPYKSTDCHASSLVITLPPTHHYELPFNHSFEEEKKQNIYYHNTFCSDNFQSIWQPPKIG